MNQAIKRAKVEDLSVVEAQDHAALNHCTTKCVNQDCASRNIENIKMEFEEVTGKLQVISSDIDHEITVYKSNKVTNEAQQQAAMAMLEEQRKEINDFFDKLEKEVKTKVTNVTENNVKRQNLVEKFQNELQALLLETQKLAQHDSSERSKALEDIKRLEDTLTKLKQENKIEHFKYQPSKQITEMMLTIKELGTVLTNPAGANDHLDGIIDKPTVSIITESVPPLPAETQSPLKEGKTHMKLEQSIRARSKNDEKACTITGVCSLPDGLIVAIDCGNCSVKMIDTIQNKTLSSVPVESDPHDVAMVSDNVVAVTLFFKRQIQLFSVSQSKELSLLNTLEASSPCYGIIHSKDELTVTHKNKLEVLNMKGEILRSLTTDSEGNQLFSHAKYLTMSSDQTTIYVSDYNNNTLTSLTTDGKVKAVYRDPELQMPFGLVVDKADYVYVCGFNSNTIHRIIGDLSRGEVILDASDGIVNPQCVGYSSKLNRLYVGMWCNDNIRAFQL